MRVSVNIEFTDDELRKHAEDVGRRWVVNAIHEVITHLPALKLNTDVASALGEVIVGAFARKAPQQSGRREDPGPTAGATYDQPPNFDKCRTLDLTPHEDGGWLCCRCHYYNGAHRPACRNCQHDRCDIVVTPPPAPSDPEPSSSTSA